MSFFRSIRPLGKRYTVAMVRPSLTGSRVLCRHYLRDCAKGDLGRRKKKARSRTYADLPVWPGCPIHVVPYGTHGVVEESPWVT